MKRTERLISLGAALSLALAACGGDDEAGDVAPVWDGRVGLYAGDRPSVIDDRWIVPKCAADLRKHGLTAMVVVYLLRTSCGLIADWRVHCGRPRSMVNLRRSSQE